MEHITAFQIDKQNIGAKPNHREQQGLLFILLEWEAALAFNCKYNPVKLTAFDNPTFSIQNSKLSLACENSVPRQSGFDLNQTDLNLNLNHDSDF